MTMRETLQKVWSEGTFVHLTLEDGGHDGFVLAVGDLVLVQAMGGARWDTSSLHARLEDRRK